MSKSFPVAILLLRTSSPWAKSTWIAGSQPWCDSWSELLFGWNESLLLQVSGCSIEHPAPIQNCSHNNLEQWGKVSGKVTWKSQVCTPLWLPPYGYGGVWKRPLQLYWHVWLLEKMFTGWRESSVSQMRAVQAWGPEFWLQSPRELGSARL